MKKPDQNIVCLWFWASVHYPLTSFPCRYWQKAGFAGPRVAGNAYTPARADFAGDAYTLANETADVYGTIWWRPYGAWRICVTIQRQSIAVVFIFIMHWCWKWNENTVIIIYWFIRFLLETILIIVGRSIELRLVVSVRCCVSDNNVTDSPLMERNWRECAIIIILLYSFIQNIVDSRYYYIRTESS